MDCSLPGSSVHGILQARILEWVAFPFSRDSSQPRDQIQVSHIVGGFLTIWATRKEIAIVFLKINWSSRTMTSLGTAFSAPGACPLAFPRRAAQGSQLWDVVHCSSWPLMLLVWWTVTEMTGGSFPFCHRCREEGEDGFITSGSFLSLLRAHPSPRMCSPFQLGRSGRMSQDAAAVRSS